MGGFINPMGVGGWLWHWRGTYLVKDLPKFSAERLVSHKSWSCTTCRKRSKEDFLALQHAKQKSDTKTWKFLVHAYINWSASRTRRILTKKRRSTPIGKDDSELLLFWCSVLFVLFFCVFHQKKSQKPNKSNSHQPPTIPANGAPKFRPRIMNSDCHETHETRLRCARRRIWRRNVGGSYTWRIIPVTNK